MKHASPGLGADTTSALSQQSSRGLAGAVARAADGSVVSQLTGTCLADSADRATAGSTLALASCTATIQQRWHIEQRTIATWTLETPPTLTRGAGPRYESSA